MNAGDLTTCVTSFPASLCPFSFTNLHDAKVQIRFYICTILTHILQHVVDDR